VDLFAARITTTIASLRAQLPGRIAAFNALGGVQIVAPADDGNALKPRRPGLGYVFGGMPRYSGGEFPVVEVAVPDAQISQLALGQVAGDLDSTIVVVGLGRPHQRRGLPRALREGARLQRMRHRSALAAGRDLRVGDRRPDPVRVRREP
jgi:hypothetical protein